MVNPITSINTLGIRTKLQKAKLHSGHQKINSEKPIPETAVSPATGKTVTAENVTRADVPKLVAKASEPHNVTDKDVQRDAQKAGIKYLIQTERSL